MARSNRPFLTIVGGQPQCDPSKHEIEVPVGLEKLLFLAAQDSTIRQALFKDRKGTVERLGYSLRPSESTMLELITDTQLEQMIDRIRPDNPKKRRLMGIVAAAATTLAAGTAMISCDETPVGGVRPGDEVDSTSGSDSDSDSDSDADGDSGEHSNRDDESDHADDT